MHLLSNVCVEVLLTFAQWQCVTGTYRMEVDVNVYPSGCLCLPLSPPPPSSLLPLCCSHAREHIEAAPEEEPNRESNSQWEHGVVIVFGGNTVTSLLCYHLEPKHSVCHAWPPPLSRRVDSCHHEQQVFREKVSVMTTCWSEDVRLHLLSLSRYDIWHLLWPIGKVCWFLQLDLSVIC